MLKKIIKFFKALNSNSKPSELANALCLGIMLGFIPKNNALWFLIFIFFCLFDSKFDSIGFYILNYAPLTKTFSMLIDIPFVGFTKFNNTIVMGSFIFSLIIYIPCFIFGIAFVKLWRKYVSSLFARTPIAKAIAKLPFAEKITSLITKDNAL